MPRVNPQEQEEIERRKAADEFRNRWVNDRVALLAEWSVTCPFCGRTIPPLVLDVNAPMKAISGNGEVPNWLHPSDWDSVPPTRIRLIRHGEDSRCGCDAEADALEDQERASNLERNERRKVAWAKALRRAGLEGWMSTASFKTYQPNHPSQHDALKVCRRYCDLLLQDALGDQTWLVLYGPNGTGKSGLAAAIVREALAHGYGRVVPGMVIEARRIGGSTARTPSGCYFRPWERYRKRLTATFHDDAEERTEDVVEELEFGRLVVIDDLDKGKVTEFVRAELERVMDTRSRLMLPTVLTCNRHPLDLVQWLGSSGVDRLLGCTREEFRVQFDGQSLRSGQQW